MAATTTPTPARPDLRLIACLGDDEWARLAEDEGRRLARARSMARHPAFRAGAVGPRLVSVDAQAERRLHLVRS